MKDKEISIPETEECTLAHVDYENTKNPVYAGTRRKCCSFFK